jgi:hypothetical protein
MHDLCLSTLFISRGVGGKGFHMSGAGRDVVLSRCRGCVPALVLEHTFQDMTVKQRRSRQMFNMGRRHPVLSSLTPRYLQRSIYDLVHACIPIIEIL